MMLPSKFRSQNTLIKIFCISSIRRVAIYIYLNLSDGNKKKEKMCLMMNQSCFKFVRSSVAGKTLPIFPSRLQIMLPLDTSPLALEIYSYEGQAITKSKVRSNVRNILKKKPSCNRLRKNIDCIS